MEKPNKLHEFDTLYVAYTFLEVNQYKYILEGADIASAYRIGKLLMKEKSKRCSLCVRVIGFEYAGAFQCDNGSELKDDVTEVIEKHNVHIRRATASIRGELI